MRNFVFLLYYFVFSAAENEIFKHAENNYERKIIIQKNNGTENQTSSEDSNDKIKKSDNLGILDISVGIEKILQRKSESCYLPQESRRFCKARIRENMNLNPFAEFSSDCLINCSTVETWLFLDNTTTSLILAGTGISTIRLVERTIDGLDNLQRLDLSFNILKHIDGNLLRHKYHMVELKAGHNKIQYLGPTVFRHTRNLESIDFSFNRIRFIAHNILAKSNGNRQEYLKKINLQGNKLKSLHPKLFHGTKELTTLNLSKNSFGRVSPSLFRGLYQLENLDLSENNLKVIQVK